MFVVAWKIEDLGGGRDPGSSALLAVIELLFQTVVLRIHCLELEEMLSEGEIKKLPIHQAIYISIVYN